MVRHPTLFDEEEDLDDRPSPISSFHRPAVNHVSTSSYATSSFGPPPSASFATLADQIQQLNTLLRHLPHDLQTPRLASSARQLKYPGDADLLDLEEHSPYFAVRPDVATPDNYRNPAYAGDETWEDVPMPSVSAAQSSQQDVMSNLSTPPPTTLYRLIEGKRSDRTAYTRLPEPIPAKVRMLRRYYYKHKGQETSPYVWHWVIQIKEAYPKAFRDWNIVIPPGKYVFEDHGCPLTIIGQRPHQDPVLFTFPLAYNQVWHLQSERFPPSSVELSPDNLEVEVQRGPVVAGFLHPHCYGVPGIIDTKKSSRQNFYVPIYVCDSEGPIITTSHAAAYYRGILAGHFSTGRRALNPLRGFSTLKEASAAINNNRPVSVPLPGVVPYIRDQLLAFDLYQDGDDGTFHDPVVFDGIEMGRKTPKLFHYFTGTETPVLWKAFETSTSTYVPSVPSNVTVSTQSTSLGEDTQSTNAVERERSKERMRRFDQANVRPMPTSTAELYEWITFLPYDLAGSCWCHGTTHVCHLLETTPETESLSLDLLTVLQRSVQAHTDPVKRRNARELLVDNVNGVDGAQLVEQGKGIELYQQRVKDGFFRGLGSEAIDALEAYVNAAQLSLESVGAFLTRHKLLYLQVTRTEGCTLGETAQKAFALYGLRRGAYQDVLATWVDKVMLGNGSLKLVSATFRDLQQHATNLLTTSKYYKDNALLPGKASPTARQAATPDTPSSDSMIENIVGCIRRRSAFNRDITAWIRANYSCPHCFSNSHTLVECKAAGSLWDIRLKAPQGGETTKGPSTERPTTNVKRENGSNTSTATNPPTARKAQPATYKEAAKGKDAGEQIPVKATPGPLSTPSSQSSCDESDDRFQFFACYATDDSLLDSIEQQALATVARQATATTRQLEEQLKTGSETPMDKIYRQGHTAARLAKKDYVYVKQPKHKGKRDITPKSSNGKKRWNDGVKTAAAYLANHSYDYPSSTPSSRVFCPDSGATKTMAPYRDMFVDYKDLRSKGLVVRLGDETKTIPIAGICFSPWD